jgi:hypothetical protein
VIRRDPMGYLVRVKNRLLAATLVYYPFSNIEGKRAIWVRSLIWSLPFIGLVVVVLSGRSANDHRARIALVVFVTYLTPYVLVAYYRRYALPIMCLQVMFEVWCLDSIYSIVVYTVRYGRKRSLDFVAPSEKAAADQAVRA